MSKGLSKTELELLIEYIEKSKIDSNFAERAAIKALDGFCMNQ